MHNILTTISIICIKNGDVYTDMDIHYKILNKSIDVMYRPRNAIRQHKHGRVESSTVMSSFHQHELIRDLSVLQQLYTDR